MAFHSGCGSTHIAADRKRGHRRSTLPLAMMRFPPLAILVTGKTSPAEGFFPSMWTNHKVREFFRDATTEPQRHSFPNKVSSPNQPSLRSEFFLDRIKACGRSTPSLMPRAAGVFIGESPGQVNGKKARQNIFKRHSFDPFGGSSGPFRHLMPLEGSWKGPGSKRPPAPHAVRSRSRTRNSG